MAKTKTAATTTKRARTGTKTTARLNAGETAKAAGAYTVPRTAKQLAAAIQQRMKRSPNFWAEVRDAMLDRPEIQRAATVEPREHATH